MDIGGGSPVPQPDALGRFNPQGGTTEAIFSVGATKRAYSALRSASHLKWIASITVGVPRSTAPFAVITGGGSASGKGALVTAHVSEQPANWAVIDADRFKVLIPEYSAQLAGNPDGAASFVHHESAHVARRAVRVAASRSLDLVFDTTLGNLEGTQEAIRALRGAGYYVRLDFADCDVEEALRREGERFQRTGRRVPADSVRWTNAAARDHLATLYREVDEVNLYITDAGPAPIMVATWSDEGGLQVFDAAHWATLQARGHRIK